MVRLRVTSRACVAPAQSWQSTSTRAVACGSSKIAGMWANSSAASRAS